MTKALHRKRPALIPMLDSVVQAYLTSDDSEQHSSESFAERASTLVRSYKRDLDRNRSALRGIQCGTREPRVPAHRGANPRPLDLVRISRDLMSFSQPW
jgi:hypothetical protein